MTLLSDIDKKLPVALGMNCALFLMFMYLNDAAASFSVYFYCGALFVVAPALFLGFWSMVFCAASTGFFFEVATPSVPGLTPAAFILASLGVYAVRGKFRSLDPLGIVSLCWVANAALYLASCLFVFPVGMANFGLYLTRVSADFLFSSMLVVLLSNFILRVYRSVFYVFGMAMSIPEDA